MSIARLSFVFGAVVAFAGAALASEPPKPVSNDEFAKICDAFGEGYHLVPGTLTCLKVGGYVQTTISVGSKSPLPPGGAGQPPQR